MILFVIIHQTAQKNKRFARDSADFFRKIVFKKGRGRIWRLRGSAFISADVCRRGAGMKVFPFFILRADACGFGILQIDSFFVFADGAREDSVSTS
ncbi:MAG: hypothetical protein K6G29_00970 [Clostridiales bacterium]|nr:hypothetical protein [Clostridiales bacterium]